MRVSGWAVMAAALVMASPAVADVKAGVEAWGRGDFTKAVNEWRGPAVAGDADAQFNLGQAYKLGRGVPLDPVLAESWFRKAALQGHAQAEDNYALALFQAGKRAEALPWLEKGAARGEARTQLVLGTMLFNGDGVPRDYPRAYALMTLASQKGLKSAGETLAQMDQYVSSQDRERGLALARQYAAQARVAASDGNTRTIARADIPPSTATGTVSQQLPPARRTPPTPRQPAPTVAASTRPTPSAPRPTAQATPRPTAASQRDRGGNWRIQLGAFRDRGNAEGLWRKVGARTGGQPAYVAGGSVTRLQATGFASRADAQRACAKSGVTCVVIAP